MYARAITLRSFSTHFLRRSAILLSRTQRHSINTQAGVRPFDDSYTYVRIKDGPVGDDDVFVCDEEPHFLKPELSIPLARASLVSS